MATTINTFRPIRSHLAALPLIRNLSLVSPFICLDTSSSSLSFQRNGLWARAQDKAPTKSRAQDKAPTGSFLSFANKQSKPNNPTNQFQSMRERAREKKNDIIFFYKGASSQPVLFLLHYLCVMYILYIVVVKNTLSVSF